MSLYAFAFLQILQLVSCESCNVNDFEKTRVSLLEAEWMQTSYFTCISRCKSELQKINVKKPEFLERVFNVKRDKVNCLSKYVNRKILPVCAKLVGDTDLAKFDDLPLYFLRLNIMLPRFAAERYCSRLNLNFGLSKIASEKFLKKSPYRIGIWSQELQITNSSNDVSKRNLHCFNFWLSDGNLIQQPHDCKFKSHFVCSLPEECHADVCESQCSPKEIDLCSPSKQKNSENCFPNCKPIDCRDEKEENIGFITKKPTDGEVVDICGRLTYISKANVSQRAAQMFCCNKNMQLVGIETHEKKTCLTNYFQKSNYSSTQFWTSGSSEKCANSFGWCSAKDKEFINLELLGSKSLESAGGKECVGANFEKSTNKSDLILQSDACKSNKRAICEERETAKRCTEQDNKCLELNGTYELGLLNLAKKGKFPNLIAYRACNKILGVDMKTQMTYYTIVKYSWGINRAVLSFETKEKFDCVLASYLNFNVPAGTYWVSATSFGCNSIVRWCNGVNNPILDINKSPWITWKNGKPSDDPLKQCVAVDFKRTPPHMTFFKTECRESYMPLSENLGPIENDFFLYIVKDLAQLNSTNSTTMKTNT